MGFATSGFFDDPFLAEVMRGIDSEEEGCNFFHSNSSTGIAKDQPYFDYGSFYDHENLRFKLSQFRLDFSWKSESLWFEMYYYFDRTIDRCFIRPTLSRNEVVELYSLISAFFRSVITTRNIKIIFFRDTPHFFYDICLFAVAKDIGIKVVIFHKTLLDGILVATDDFRVNHGNYYCLAREQFPVSSDQINRSSMLEFGAKLTVDPKSVFLMSKGPIWDTIRRLMHGQEKHYLVSLLLNIFRLIVKGQIGPSYLRLDRRAIWFFATAIIQRAKIRRDLERPRLLDKLNSRDIVCLFLQYQPERSTDPEGGRFSHQANLVAQVREAIPPSSVLLVKEHPRQTLDLANLREWFFRKPSDYDYIENFKDTFLVGPNVESSKLLEMAKVVVTTTGSIAWEAIMADKPCITFGLTWHSLCEASFVCPEPGQLPNVITEAVQQDPGFVRRARKKFLVRIGEELGFYGCQRAHEVKWLDDQLGCDGGSVTLMRQNIVSFLNGNYRNAQRS